MRPIRVLTAAQRAAEADASTEALVVVSVVVGLLTILALLFAGMTVLLRIRNDRVARRWKRLEAAWEPLILDVLVGARPAEALHAAVRPADRLYFVSYLLRFARRFRGEEFALVAGLAQPYLPALVPLIRHRSPEVRARAIQTLANLRLTDYEEAVIRAMDDPDPLVAVTAARALARNEHPEYAPVVMAHLDRFDSLSRGFLAALLAAMGPAAAPALRDTLADPRRRPRVRAIAAEALALLRDADAADVAAEVVVGEENRELLASALRLLGRIGRPDHAAAVRRRAASWDEVVRAQALRVLGRIGGESDVPAVLAALDEPVPWVALHAAYALAELGGADVLRERASEESWRGEVAREVLESPGAA